MSSKHRFERNLRRIWNQYWLRKICTLHDEKVFERIQKHIHCILRWNSSSILFKRRIWLKEWNERSDWKFEIWNWVKYSKLENFKIQTFKWWLRELVKVSWGIN